MKKNKKAFRITFTFVALVLLYLCGPRVSKPDLSLEFPQVTHNLPDLADSIALAEASVDSIKPGQQSEIFWYKDSVIRSEYSVVYLHGFSASKYEGLPVAKDYARRYGMNLYMPRLDQHGIYSSDPLLNMTAEGLWQSAKDALAVGLAIGDKVILMSTSTGGTLALNLAAEYPEKVFALINVSPNILPANIGIELLTGPWGLQIARIAQGGKYKKIDQNSYHPQEWSEGVRMESVVQLQALVEQTMKPSTFARITAPSLTLVYYKDRKNQDPTVRVDKIRWMNDHLATPKDKKRLVELPTVGVHTMASSIVSKDIPAVENAMFSFTEGILGIKPE